MQEVAAVFQVVQHIDAGFGFFHFAHSQIAVGDKFPVAVGIAVNDKHRTGELVVGIFIIHLCGGNGAFDEAIDHFNFDGLFICLDSGGEDGFIQHIAVGRLNFTHNPLAIGNVLKDKRAGCRFHRKPSPE